jgi:acyl carrier protein
MTPENDTLTSVTPDVKSTMRMFILDTFLVAPSDRDIGDGESFIERHLVDSTGFLEIIMFLEDTWGITVHDDEVVPENLDSLDGLEAFVSRKVAGR